MDLEPYDGPPTSMGMVALFLLMVVAMLGWNQWLDRGRWNNPAWLKMLWRGFPFYLWFFGLFFLDNEKRWNEADDSESIVGTDFSRDARVARIIDGDTLVLDDGTRVRLYGIDTPERGQPGFAEATAALSAFCNGRDVVLVLHGTDRYGRTLAEVWVGDREAGAELLARRLAVPYYGGPRAAATSP